METTNESLLINSKTLIVTTPDDCFLGVRSLKSLPLPTRKQAQNAKSGYYPLSRTIGNGMYDA